MARMCSAISFYQWRFTNYERPLSHEQVAWELDWKHVVLMRDEQSIRVKNAVETGFRGG